MKILRALFSPRTQALERVHLRPALHVHTPDRYQCACISIDTAWDSEIESLTSVDDSLIEPDRRKTRRRHRVPAALAPSKSCLLPCKGRPARELCIAEAWFTIAFFFRMIQLSSSSARRDHSCGRQNQVQERNLGELAAVNQERTTRRVLVSFSFIFPLLWFVLRRSKCSEWLLLGVATTN